MKVSLMTLKAICFTPSLVIMRERTFDGFLRSPQSRWKSSHNEPLPTTILMPDGK